MKMRVLLIALLCTARVGIAQAPAVPPPASTSSPAESAAADGRKAAPVKTPDAAPPPKPAAAKGSPQRFEPSERVRPDFDVAFPVDI